MARTGRAVAARVREGERSVHRWTHHHEFEIRLPGAEFSNVGVRHDAWGQTTVGAISFTQSQFLMILALAEPQLRRVGTGSVDIP